MTAARGIAVGLAGNGFAANHPVLCLSLPILHRIDLLNQHHLLGLHDRTAHYSRWVHFAEDDEVAC